MLPLCQTRVVTGLPIRWASLMARIFLKAG